nr:hypothetical protein [Lentilactobacillus otakiensis]
MGSNDLDKKITFGLFSYLLSFIVVMLFGIAFVSPNVNADIQAPAINNGTSTYSQNNINLQKLNGNANQQYGVRFQFNNDSSMYTAPGTPFFSSRNF